MGFLDNSRDIIVDAVLTDLGRRRLAEGNFSIVRFALGDDEINYGLYDLNHPSGSAYYDLEVLQTPVFEAFTNNISTMNSRLVTYNTNTLLYLPVINLNTFGLSKYTAVVSSSPIGGSQITPPGGRIPPNAPNSTSIACGIAKTTFTNLTNVFLVAVDSTTETKLSESSVLNYIQGSSLSNQSYIRLDQGIDNAAMSSTSQIDRILLEEEYTVEIDNRFGYLTFGGISIAPSFIDDDDVALYNFSLLNNTRIPNVNLLAPYIVGDSRTYSDYAVKGARGTALRFGVYATQELQNSTNYWFDTVGSTVSAYSKVWKIIHSTVTVTGLKTGYSIDVPVTFIKYISG